MPECHLETVRRGIAEESGWTREMCDAKEKLRELTVHELGHSMGVDEEEIGGFIDELLFRYHLNRVGRDC